MEQTSTYITVHGYGQYLDLEKAERAGLVNPPPMESSLASYLASSYNHGMAGHTTASSKHCRFFASQFEKSYRAQGHCPCTELCYHASDIPSHVSDRDWVTDIASWFTGASY